LAAACGTGARPSLAPDSTPPPTTAPPSATTTVPTVDPATVDVSIVATAAVPTVEVFDDPTATRPSRTLANPIESGGPLVFLVQERGDTWQRVLLPVRPNGSSGWVRAADVTLSGHNYRIRVRLDAHNFELLYQGRTILETRCAVARENAPTPGGLYYTTELLQPPDPDGPYGTYAYGLSGFSEVFTSFAGGPGQLGIHGTDEPESIGTDASSGCVRLVNADIELLAGMLPLGVPVEIIA
jgi:lipoprotein-anchoring transpeptidase ErfK/SrfK